MIPPKHVAIIMDGNGRWGIKKKKSRNYGHSKGIEVVQEIIKASITKKINYLTLFAFSTENWKRPISEISFLIKLLSFYIDEKSNEIIKQGIKIKIIGNISKFPKKLQNKLNKLQIRTISNNKIQINIALNYGSREEILFALKKINKLKLNVSKKNLEKFLYTYKMPDPDILIRTGNTKRISNFLLWQSIYTEIFFEKKLWPDFNKYDFYKIINKFNKINRNFGGLNE
jgi:undecaprenyl diphosphate synthase